MSESNTAVGQRIQEKFQFYILGLIFTLLGLSVQTASFGTSAVADILELISWALLLTSALVLASRLEWAPQIYRLFDAQQEIKDIQSQLKQAQLNGLTQASDRATGEATNIDVLLQRIDKRSEKVATKIGELDKGAETKYKIHKYSFLIGLVALVSGRAYIPLFNLITKIVCGA